MIGSPFFRRPLEALEKSIETIQLALLTLPDDQLGAEASKLDVTASEPRASIGVRVMRTLYREEADRRQTPCQPVGKGRAL